MRWIDSLQRRIVVAYVLLAIGTATFFTVLAALAVEGIEVHLVDNRLKSVAAWASPRYAARLPVSTPAGIIFYHGESIPPALRGLEPGVQEQHINGIDMHVLAGKDSMGDYVVVDRESDYEKIELLVYSTIAVGVTGFVALSLMLGRFLARRLVVPLSTLAISVSEQTGQASLPYTSNNDEIGVLARAFAARTAELNMFLERERRFTGDVSHELRTSLTIISGAAELLTAQGEVNPAMQATVDRIIRAANEASESINVLLMLARAPEEIDAPRTRLIPLIQRELERSRPLLAGRPVEMVFSHTDDLSIAAHPELLTAAIGNLIRNACQYTQQGSLKVSLTEVAVVIEDTGPGLPAAIRTRLFDDPQPFERLDAAGPGLGLALAKRICDHLGAKLSTEVPPGGGTRFRIVFPQDLNENLTAS